MIEQNCQEFANRNDSRAGSFELYCIYVQHIVVAVISHRHTLLLGGQNSDDDVIDETFNHISIRLFSLFLCFFLIFF